MRISSSRVELHHRGGTRYLDVKISCCETSPKLGLAKKQNEPTGSSGPADMLKVNTSIRLAHGTRAPRCTLFGTVRRDTVVVAMETPLSAPQHGVTTPACSTSWFRTGFIVWISQDRMDQSSPSDRGSGPNSSSSVTSTACGGALCFSFSRATFLDFASSLRRASSPMTRYTSPQS